MCFVMSERIESPLARTSALFIHAVTASISRTHSQCQRRGLTPLTAGEPAELVFFIPGKIAVERSALGGAYRDRTDDLKLAKLALSQLS